MEVHAAVDEVGLAGDESRVFAREIQHQRHHFLRLAETADRLPGFQTLLLLKRIALDLDRAGPDAVRRDLVRGELASDAARESDDAELRHAFGNAAAEKRRDPREIDDAAP